MLIPNFGPYKLMPFSDESSIKMSENDINERLFPYSHFLRTVVQEQNMFMSHMMNMTVFM